MTSSDGKYSQLWVCFEPPSIEIPSNVIVLSFMSPEKEADYKRLLGDRFVNGRKVTELVREDARKTYTNMIADLASTPCVFGKTLRELLTGRDGVSRWWYLKVSSKDSVHINSPYTPILRLYCIKSVADQWKIKDISLFGAPYSFYLCLKESFRIYIHKSEKSSSYDLKTSLFCRLPFIYGLAERIYFAIKELYKLQVLKKVSRSFNGPVEIALQGFWDWSFNMSKNSEPGDVYFADLPKKLKAMGYSVGWFTYIDYSKKGHSYKKMIYEATEYPAVILIERYLRVWDVLRAVMKIQYFIVLFLLLLSGRFKFLFMRDGFNLYPLFRSHIISSISGMDIPYHELISLAIKRASDDLKPKVILTFQELFSFSRAFYAGARNANYPSKVFTAQHAAYSSDKTIGTLVPDVEANGQPDGCKMPLPDKIFVMGRLSERIFLKNGFPNDRVILSGGLRYQHITITDKTYKKKSYGSLTILLICGMNEYYDIDMCEAVCAATVGLRHVQIILREHPYYRITHLDSFNRFRHRIEASTNTQQIDLANADLVIFTHSSFPDEILLQGIPIWQWLWGGFNTSVFLDFPIIPVFCSVDELKESINKFMDSPDSFYPAKEVKEKVLIECFGPYPERAAGIITSEIVKQLKEM